LYDEKLARTVGLDLGAHVRVVNPLSREQELLRYQLLPLMLKKSGMASREDSMLFWYEIGRCFRETGEPLPEEQEHLALVIVGPDSYRVLKGVITAALAMLSVPKAAVRWHASETLYGAGQDILIGGRPAGSCSALSQALRDSFKFRHDLAVAEIPLEPIHASQTERRYEAFSPFPAVLRDIAFWLPDEILFADVEKALRAIDPLLAEHEVFDVYESKNRRSIALRLIFQSKQRTLSATDVDAVMHKIVSVMTKTVRAEMRTE